MIEFLGFRADPARRRVLAPDGVDLPIRPREFDTLMVLLGSAGKVVSKDELMAAVWPDTVVEENNLNQAISHLRQQLGDDRRNPKFITTITGRGYQFVAPVRQLDTSLNGAEAGRQSTSIQPSAKRPHSVLASAAAITVIVALSALILFPRFVAEPPLDLSGAERAGASPASESEPSLSPDGTMVAFVSDLSGTSQIWLKSTSTGEAVQLTRGDYPASDPSWSPASDRILYVVARPNLAPSVWVVDALGSQPPRLVIEDARKPSFAPDGETFVFVRGPNRIHVGAVADGSSRELEGVPAKAGFAPPDPAINANGDVVFVLAEEGPSGDLWLFEDATGEFRQLTRSEGPMPGVWAEAPVWLPDGKTVVYAASPGTPFNAHLWSINVDTDRTTQLTSGVGGYGSPTVSRNAEVFAYSHARPVWRIIRTDPLTGTHETLHETRDALALPVMSADGRTLSYFGENLYTLPVDGGAPKPWFGDIDSAATLPSWSRDAPVVWFYRDRGLYRLDIQTGSSELVLEDFHWTKTNWLAAHGDRLAYRVRSRLPGRGKSVLHDLSTGEILTFETNLLPADFSRDGRHLLARRIPGSDIVICATTDLSCSPILHEGKPVDGAVPRWSHDEQRVFFRRARQDKPGHAWIWVTERDGSSVRQLVEVGPYDSASFLFGVAHDDTLVWPEFDHAADPEIWLVRHALSREAR